MRKRELFHRHVALMLILTMSAILFCACGKKGPPVPPAQGRTYIYHAV